MAKVIIPQKWVKRGRFEELYAYFLDFDVGISNEIGSIFCDLGIEFCGRLNGYKMVFPDECRTFCGKKGTPANLCV